MKYLIICGAIIGVLLLGCLGVYNYANGIQQEGVARETELNNQYLDNQNELSTYIAKFYETVGVANLKSDKMDQILLDAVKGRYEGHTSAQPGQGQLFSAITEAYPNIDMSIYDRILDQISAGRDAYKQKQSKLLDMLRSYDKWRESGLVQSRIIAAMGVPTQHLEARIGTLVKHGAEARDQMYLIVLTQSTTDAYTSGHLDPPFLLRFCQFSAFYETDKDYFCAGTVSRMQRWQPCEAIQFIVQPAKFKMQKFDRWASLSGKM